MARTKRRKPAAKTKKSNSKSVQDEEEVEEPQSDDQSPGLGNVTLSKAKPAGGDAENESEHGDDDENSEEEEVDELADDESDTSVAAPISITLVLPRAGKGDKSYVFSSDITFASLFDQVTTLLGVGDPDEKLAVTLAYKRSNGDKRTRSLEDQGDWDDLVRQAREHAAGRSKKSLEFNIISTTDPNSDIDLEDQPQKAKSGRKRNGKGKKAKSDTISDDTPLQQQIDENVAALNTRYPKCPRHGRRCWTGHPSGKHVPMTLLMVSRWGTQWAVDDRRSPDERLKIDLEHPPSNIPDFNILAEDPTPLKQGGPRPVSEPVQPVQVTINLGDLAAKALGVPTTPKGRIAADDEHVQSSPITSLDLFLPSIDTFLLECQRIDAHHRDFLAYQAALLNEGILGPDDVAAIGFRLLSERCGIPLGAASFLDREAERVVGEARKHAHKAHH